MKRLNLTLMLAMIPHLSAGTPGCLKMILERPVTERMAIKLKPNCKDLRSAYLGSLDLYSKSPQKFESEVKLVLKSNQGAEPAYRAILMASLFQDANLIPALELRAKIEQAKKLRYQYAAAAIERVKSGTCSKNYSESNYDEVCRLSSPVARHLVALSGPVTGAPR